MPDFNIITLSPTDWQRYRDIRLEALKTEPAAFLMTYEAGAKRSPEEWRERLESMRFGGAGEGEESWLFVAQAGERPVGLMGAYPVQGTNEAEVVQVYVSPDWRGKGVGTALMEALLAALARAGIQAALLAVNANQTAALALYQKMGFRITGQEQAKRPDGQEYTKIEMEKRI